MATPKVPQPDSSSHRYALCVGIGKYTNIPNRDLRYTVEDAEDIKKVFEDPERGDFTVTLLTKPEETTKSVLERELHHILNTPNSDDLVVIYFSCHGELYNSGQTFCLLPSDAVLEKNGKLNNTKILDEHDLAKLLSDASVKNIILLLDVCYSGGAGNVLPHLHLQLKPDVSIYIVGAARRDHVAIQSSKLKHGIFTDALLKAFSEKPTGANEWLTITQITSSVHNVIQSYQRSEYNDVQLIDITYHVVNPNLPLVKNPHYSPASKKFAREVEQLLELRSYRRVETRIPREAPPNFYLTSLDAGFDTEKVGIIPFYNEVMVLEDDEAEKIAQFVVTQIREGYMDRGMMVIAQNEASGVSGQYKTGSLTIKTLQYIQGNLINFQRYLQRLQKEYKQPDSEDNPPLAEIYVPLNAVPYGGTKGVDIEQEVKRWLSDSSPTSTRLAILADYGSGKSTFCRHLAAIMAQEYLGEKENVGFSGARIPLLIPLRDFSEYPFDLKSYLIRYLVEYYQIESTNSEALMKMAEVGRLLFLFDGFDEMASKATADTLKANIAQIEQLAIARNKVLVTTRQEHFMNMAEEQDVFQKYKRFSLQPFNDLQIQSYLQKRVPFIKTNEGEPLQDWTYYQQQIDKIPNLNVLRHRPVLLEMIVKTLPDLLRGGQILNSANLYRLYINKELDRRTSQSRHRDHIGRQERFEIMERIALEFYQKNSIGLSSTQIHAITYSLLTAEQQKEVEVWLRDIVTRSLLSRKDNTYWFSHESFMEYLLAYRLAKDITQGKKELFRLKVISKAIRDFLLELEEGRIQTENNTENVPFNQVSFQKATLIRWFKEGPQDPIISSNIFTLLVRMLSSEEIGKLPLQAANLTEADLAGIHLQQVQFEGTTLENADLEGANLEGAD